MNIRIILTGGTFDKEYDEIKAELGFDSTHVDEMLQVSRFNGEVNVDQLLLKDSLDLTQADRDLITNACRDCEENQIIITHGTDTMVETALDILKAQLADKVVIITGAMVPFSLGVESDA